MIRSSKVQYFETEGRANLSSVIRAIRAFLKSLDSQSVKKPEKIVFLTVQGEGPMLAYNQLQNRSPFDHRGNLSAWLANKKAGMEKFFEPQISQKVRDFFSGVKIPIVTNRLPFDDIIGADGHNREMKLLRETLALFGSSVPLAVQAVLQATDAGHVQVGEQVIVATGDTALLVTATSTRMLLQQDHQGFSVNEIICKPRAFTMSRPLPMSTSASLPDGQQIEGQSKEPTL